MIVWRGLGIFCIIIPAAVHIIIQVLLNMLNTSLNSDLITAIALLILSVPTIKLGRYLNYGSTKAKRQKGDAINHSLMFIPFEYYGFLYLIYSVSVIIFNIII